MRISLQANPSRLGQYRADIDGLRAIAVLSVVFFHAKVFRCPGGFVGVDVFFVISGYLITSLIAKDLEQGSFSFISFYDRRMRRIFPALFGLLFFCSMVTVLLLVPRDLVAFGKSLLAATTFISNLYFWRTAAPLGYFAGASHSQVLLHTWSLSVEEQFYLVFPGLLLILFRRAKGQTKTTLWVLVITSFCLNVWATYSRPIAAFYLFVPRAWELLVGALLALKAVPAPHTRIIRETLGALGLGMVVGSVFWLTESTPFPGFSVLPACVGAWLIIYTGVEGASAVNRLLSFQPLIFVGTLSYSLYLWHWPLLVFTRYFSARELTKLETGEVLVCSLLIAFLSFEFVERPFRGSDSSFSRRQVFSLGLAASLTAVVIGFTVHLSHGFPQRYDLRTRQLVEVNESRMADYVESCGNWRRQVRSLADLNICQMSGQSAKKIMFLGDSHIGQLYPAIKAIYANGGFGERSVLVTVEPGCLPAETLNSIGEYYCDSVSKIVYERAEQSDVSTVFIGFNTAWSYDDGICCFVVDGRCTKVLSRAEVEEIFLSELASHIRNLRRLGKRVIVSLPFPMYDKSIPEMEIRNAVFGKFGLSWRAVDQTSPTVRDHLRLVVTDAGADVFDPRATLCPGNSCITEIDGDSIYKDAHHIAASTVGMFETNLSQALLQPNDRLQKVSVLSPRTD